MIAARHDPLHLRPLALEPVEINNATAHLNGTDRGVVLVLDHDLHSSYVRL
jgi:hypothetical protein